MDPEPTPPAEIPATFITRVPAAALRPWVTRIVGYQERSAVALRQVEPASLSIPLIFSLGGAFRIGFGPEPPAAVGDFVGGPYAGPVTIRSDGAAACVQIDLTPAGAFRLLGLPLAELNGRLVDPAVLIGRDADALRHRLLAAADWPARLGLAESFVATRIAGADRSLPADVSWAYGRLVAMSGQVRIRSLFEEIGCSKRHFIGRFSQAIGLKPKEVARIARLNAAVSLLGDQSLTLAGIAADCGFADQAHMTREMAVLAGRTPGTARGL